MMVCDFETGSSGGRMEVDSSLGRAAALSSGSDCHGRWPAGVGHPRSPRDGPFAMRANSPGPQTGLFRPHWHVEVATRGLLAVTRKLDR